VCFLWNASLFTHTPPRCLFGHTRLSYSEQQAVLRYGLERLKERYFFGCLVLGLSLVSRLAGGTTVFMHALTRRSSCANSASSTHLFQDQPVFKAGQTLQAKVGGLGLMDTAEEFREKSVDHFPCV
jgi:hypothetical protein